MTIKVGIISGFLGSGKTTAILEIGKILGDRFGLKSAILVNDIGEINVDGAYLEGLGMDAKQVTGSCLCCSLGTSILDTINILREKFGPDVLLIEPTGVAIPSQVKQRFYDGFFGEGFEIAPLIVLIDGFDFLEYLETVGELIERQAQDVEIIAINKMDLIEDKEKLGKIKEMIKKINPNAEILEISAKNREGIDELVEIIMGNGRSKNA